MRKRVIQRGNRLQKIPQSIQMGSHKMSDFIGKSIAVHPSLSPAKNQKRNKMTGAHMTRNSNTRKTAHTVEPGPNYEVASALPNINTPRDWRPVTNPHNSSGMGNINNRTIDHGNVSHRK